MIHIDDPGKLAGDAELIDARPGRRVYLIVGYFNIFRVRFDGHMVLMTVYSERRENATVSMGATTTAYVKIGSAFAAAFARLADYLFPTKVDERIERFLRAAEAIAVAVHKDPADVYRKLLSAGEVSAEELEEFGRTFLTFSAWSCDSVDYCCTPTRSRFPIQHRPTAPSRRSAGYSFQFDFRSPAPRGLMHPTGYIDYAVRFFPADVVRLVIDVVIDHITKLFAGNVRRY